MPADLVTSGTFSKTSVLIESDHLLLALPTGVQDRIVRLPLERIESVVVSQKIPVLYVVWYVLFLVLPGIVSVFGSFSGIDGWIAMLIVGVLLLVLAGVMLDRAIIQKTTTLRIHSEGRQVVLTIVTRQKKLDEFLQKVSAAIEQRHSILRQAPAPAG